MRNFNEDIFLCYNIIMIWFIKDINAENAILSAGFYVQWLVIDLMVVRTVYMKEAKIKLWSFYIY